MRGSKKCLMLETFVIGDEKGKRFNIHSEKKIVMAKEIKVAQNFKRVLALLNE